MKYVEAMYQEYTETMMYRFYITDTFFYQAENKKLSVQYKDVITPKPKDTRSGDEIALEVITKLGLQT